MKLITEANFESIGKFAYESEEGGKKHPYIEGIFIQTEKKNRNGRIYPKSLMEKCIENYIKDRFPNEKTKKWRTFGELGHPEGVEINLHRVSHMITELRWSGNDVIGKAKILDTEYGRIAESLLKADGQLGVSSRGLGNVEESLSSDNVLVTEYELITVDIVADPSAPDGFVNGILENVEYIRVGGKYTPKSLMKSEKAYKNLKESLISLPKKERNQYLIEVIKKFLDDLA
ncbi:MAG: primosomal protein [Candidatus Dojkabacteria bacterium]|nr:primosomal protein [Candidatus Dojkabacteria bacterium]